jgi:hypothetical protein
MLARACGAATAGRITLLVNGLLILTGGAVIGRSRLENLYSKETLLAGSWKGGIVNFPAYWLSDSFWGSAFLGGLGGLGFLTGFKEGRLIVGFVRIEG